MLSCKFSLNVCKIWNSLKTSWPLEMGNEILLIMVPLNEQCRQPWSIYCKLYRSLFQRKYVQLIKNWIDSILQVADPAPCSSQVSFGKGLELKQYRPGFCNEHYNGKCIDSLPPLLRLFLFVNNLSYLTCSPLSTFLRRVEKIFADLERSRQ